MPAPESPPLTDPRGRPLRDLRLSVTDRCNFRCRYCMPKEHFGPGFRFLPRADLLRFEEIARVARVFASLGVKKLRLTGGEPLLRSDLPDLVAQLATIEGVDLALTTNGSLLEARADELVRAGLRRVTVSLDSLDEAIFRQMTDAALAPTQVLAGIEAAARAGLRPVKVNCVVRRGVNDHGIVDLARHFKGSGHVLRFIELMDVGATNGWRMDQVVSGAEIVEKISRELPLEPDAPSYRGEVAKRWRYADGSGEIGVITSVTSPFCGDCSRARLSAEGSVYTCLFATAGTDLRGPIRAGATDAELCELIRTVWSRRDDRYSELRSENTQSLRRIEMSYIGG
ncbi:MAG: GTP 3',8-cyclase MoaA [Polyangiaceae bacterium]|nr:GTP 3',8-cyclase MoaA [Polyangiaceae bacterium]